MSMINLMPPSYKESIAYARRNSVLIRWFFGIAVAALGIALVASGGLFYLRQDSETLQASIVESQKNLEEQEEKQTLERVSEISGTLKLATDVLSGQVVFSDLLQQIGLLMPRRTVLQNLSLSDELTGGVNLIAGAADRDAAAQIPINLADPSTSFFEKVDLNSIQCANDPEDPYPCIVNIRALFKNGHNPFLLINKGEAN